MNNNDSRHYPTVEFPEYLDNGSSDIALPNSHLLDAPVTRSSATKTNGLSISARYLRGSESSDRPRLLSGYSRVCETLLGVPAVEIEFPGGAYRYSCRLKLADGRSIIATRRDAQGRALLEARVLHHLHHHLALVPEPLGFNGVVLLQQDLPGERLPDLLRQADASAVEKTLGNALASLADLHRKAEMAGLDDAVPVMGLHPDWLISLLDRPAVIGGFFGIPSPPVPIDAFFDLLVVLQPRFLKWDARPGNAVVDESGRVSWFDWEHCCARNRLDDMVWLLCDESVPANCPEAEERLVEAYLPLFADGRNPEEAHLYLRVFGILHLCVRLGRILHVKGTGTWAEADRSLEKRESPATLRESQRLCSRAAYWSEKTEYTSVLASWFREIGGRLEEM
jgi:hypothetical protein